eukprot:scaffold173528_cov31-Tisochrysis_lutea.AAC.2
MGVPKDVELRAHGPQLLVKLDCSHALGHLVHLGDRQLLSWQKVRAGDDIALQRDGELVLVQLEHEAPRVVVSHRPDAVFIKLDRARMWIKVVELVGIPRFQRHHSSSRRELGRASVYICKGWRYVGDDSIPLGWPAAAPRAYALIDEGRRHW